MNIDLLVTQKGEAGLLCSKNLIAKALGAILDTDNGILSLEFEIMDQMDLNIPIEAEYFELLDATTHLHVGSVKDNKIGQAYQIPLLFLNDPYRTQMLQHTRLPEKPLSAFHYFVKNCVLGQPVHRDDMGDEETIGCILGDITPSSLEFAQHLVRRHGMELQNIQVQELNVPGLGLGGSGSARRTNYTNSGKKTDTSNKDED